MTPKKFAGLVVLAACLFRAHAGDDAELKVKRQEVFEFSEKPRATRNGKTVEISFTSKAACDATLAIEDGKGEILRHLASGVLGTNAPAPFAKGSLQQTIVWDGKDDEGNYVTDLDGVSVRVSLGLNPQFEKSLFDEPKKRYSSEQQALICPTKEGVYVYDGGNAVDFVRLYDHDGNYLQTVYPFPGNKIKDVKGLFWHDYPEDGRHLPIKANFLQNSLLTGGTQAFNLLEYEPQENTYRTKNWGGYCHYGMDGRNASAFAVRNGRVAFANMLLNRLATDGSSGGMMLTGPRTSLVIKSEGGLDSGKEFDVPPRCAALSPDGKTVYLANYVFSHKTMAGSGAIHHTKWACFHGVYKLNMDDDAPMQLFAGTQKVDDPGSDNAHFNVPASIAVDNDGLVYIADYMNDRVQVFSPAGKYERTIKVTRPAQISIDPVHNELIVASYLLINFGLQTSKDTFPASLTRLGPLSNPVKIASYPLPLQTYVDHIEYHYYGSGDPISVGYDPYGPTPLVWVSEEYPAQNIVTATHAVTNIRVYEIKDKALALKRDFMDEVKKSVVRIDAPKNSRQRLNVNPKTGKLYVCEGQCADVYEGFNQLLEIDPENGKIGLIELPFDAEDMCFDHNGLIYLRTYSALARYDMDSGGKFREVPWDYGDECSGATALSASCNSGRRTADAQSALLLPANGGWHSGGMFVSLNGNLAVGCNYVSPILGKQDKDLRLISTGRPYQPALYPGRSISGRGGGIFIHVWDKHGKMVIEDAVRGIADNTYGLGLDTENNVYALAAATRYYNGKMFFNDMSGTLGKFISKKTKILSDSPELRAVPIQLPRSDVPQRSPDFANGAQGHGFVESGVEWLYGGVGFCGKNVGNGCACFNCRFAFDYFNRSFAPELDRYSVAVIDGSGNLITRVGQYGNRDSAGAKSAVPLGGDEVGLLHGAYVAVHSDHRLFIADPGNGRIVSVKLNYHASESIALKDVAAAAR